MMLEKFSLPWEKKFTIFKFPVTGYNRLTVIQTDIAGFELRTVPLSCCAVPTAILVLAQKYSKNVGLTLSELFRKRHICFVVLFKFSRFLISVNKIKFTHTCYRLCKILLKTTHSVLLVCIKNANKTKKVSYAVNF